MLSLHLRVISLKINGTEKKNDLLIETLTTGAVSSRDIILLFLPGCYRPKSLKLKVTSPLPNAWQQLLLSPVRNLFVAAIIFQNINKCSHYF